MLKYRRVIIDTNVWIAYFTGDACRCPEVVDLFEACIANDVELLYTPTSLKDVFYLIPRVLRRMEQTTDSDAEGVSFAPSAWACMRTMADIATAAPLSMAECELAWMLRGTHADLEDNLIVAAAETVDAGCIVTYDEALVKHFAPLCAKPHELTALVSAL